MHLLQQQQQMISRMNHFNTAKASVSLKRAHSLAAAVVASENNHNYHTSWLQLLIQRA
jgi:hypothetical protein